VVIGVLPQSFQFPDRQTQAWIPPRLARDGPGSRAAVVARLADGVSLEAAAAEALPLVRRILAGQPNSDGATYELVSEHGEIVNPVRPALLVLLSGVGLVLLIACVNVANLVLARTAAKQREIAIRRALGAGRSRLIRYLLTESVTLGLLGGLAGVVLAMVGIPSLKALATTVPRLDLGNQLSFPRLDDVRIDGTVLGFSIAVALVTGVSFGLLPALRHARSGPAEVLRGSAVNGVPAMGFGRRTSVQGMLVVAQIGLAMVLLTGGALLLKSFVNLSSVDAGYDPNQVLTFQVATPTEKYPPTRLLPFAADVAERVRSVPGVVGAAYANQLPMVDIVNSFPLRATPFTPTPEMPRLPPTAGAPDVRLVSGGYLDVMRIRVLAGRGLSEADGAGRRRVLVINEALARRDFADRSPIGQIVYVGPDPNPWEIVGVVANVRQFGLGLEAQPQFFVNLQQWTLPALVFPVGAYFAVRTVGDPMSIVAQIRAIVRQVDPEAVVFYVAPMDEVVSSTLTRPRLYTVLLALFSIVGVGLSVIGIYGVMAYAVAQGTREIGIRIALGAQQVEVLRLVLREGFLLTAIGLSLGLAGAALFTRYLKGLLYGLEPLDPGTFAGVAVLFAAVAALAALIPARRAMRIDPLVALRTE
jgi:putative ABC transport system permease protein